MAPYIIFTYIFSKLKEKCTPNKHIRGNHVLFEKISKSL